MTHVLVTVLILSDVQSFPQDLRDTPPLPVIQTQKQPVRIDYLNHNAILLIKLFFSKFNKLRIR